MERLTSPRKRPRPSEVEDIEPYGLDPEPQAKKRRASSFRAPTSVSSLRDAVDWNSGDQMSLEEPSGIQPTGSANKRKFSDPLSPLLPPSTTLESPSLPPNKRRKVEMFDIDTKTEVSLPAHSPLFNELQTRYMVNKHYSEVNPVLRQLHQEKIQRRIKAGLTAAGEPEHQ